jgi:hypothetical protein
MKTPLYTSASALALASVLSASGGSGVQPLHDGFDGTNLGGWIYNLADELEPSGGNPGGWLHQPNAQTFAPIFNSTATAFTGNYRMHGVTRLSFDARTDSVDFGNGSGFEMSILLRDTKGTPIVDDDDYAYFVGPNIPLEGAGWTHYDFDIPSADTSAVPTGWKGGWVGDGENFRPGITWNHVIESVDRIEIWWLDPALFAIFQGWNVGLDSISFFAEGSSVVRNGGGSNPVGFAETGPATIGGTWDTTVDLATPGDVVSVLTLGFGGPTSGAVFPGVGELLVLPPFKSFFATGTHSLNLPLDPSLLGVCLSSQAATIAPDLSITFNNALDFTIGG